MNPLLVSTAFVIAFLLITKVDYQTYNEGAKYISYLLTPATVCLAVPLYKQLKLLQQNMLAVVGGISSGVAASAVSIFLLSLIHIYNRLADMSWIPVLEWCRQAALM